jgi:GT2 family glycosyltransferase
MQEISKNMEVSILIVSHNRKEELRYTLSVLEEYTKGYSCEVLVFLDACTDGSKSLLDEFPWVIWELSNDRFWASPARNLMYNKAKGAILIGFDDDAHPLNPDFLQLTKNAFEHNSDVAILAYQEIRGILKSDFDDLKKANTNKTNNYCSEFVGCGFAIRADVYKKTRGFPIWMDIYCEEGCVAIETQVLGYQILKTNNIEVNHRINKKLRNIQGRNYFRFQKQLKNETSFYLVYYPYPIKILLRLYWYNFKTYAIKDQRYFFLYFKVLVGCIVDFKEVMKFRYPVSSSIINMRRELKMFRE